MRKIKFYEENSNLYCQIISSQGKSYINDYEDFLETVNSLAQSDFSIKFKDNDMILETKEVVCMIPNYRVVLSRSEFNNLALKIKETIERDGFMDLSNRDKMTPKKESKFKNSVVKRAGCIALTATLIVSIIGSAIISNLVEAEEIEIEAPTVNYEGLTKINGAAQFEGMELAEPSVNTDGLYNPLEDPDYVPPTPEDLIIPGTIDKAIVEFDDWSDTEKAAYARDNYYDLFCYYSEMYGLDPNLMLGIGTQEKGYHSSEIDTGGGLGLMQVQYSEWAGKTVTAYKLNTETGKFDPIQYTFTDEKLRNLETNIEAGCIIFQISEIDSDYNIPVTIQMYNMGGPNTNIVLDAYASAAGKTRSQVLADPLDLGWMAYRYLVAGNRRYLEEVNKWLPENTFTVTNVFTNEKVSIEFTNSKREAKKEANTGMSF